MKWTINDAEKFINFLNSAKGGNVPNENIYYLKNEKAKKANILAYTKVLFEKAGPNDRVIFYWSGYGTNGALVPHDGALNLTTHKAYNLLYFDELKEIMKSAKCHTKLIFADACHSGGLKKNKSVEIKGKFKSLESPFLNQQSEVAIMVASEADENSSEYGSLKQGVFSYYLIKGIEGEADTDKNKVVIILELHAYVFKNVREYNPKQTPCTFGKFDSNMIVSTLN